MGKIIIFGAGGRAGRTAAEEAVRRGHQVTLVVRDPAKYPDLANTVAGDITDGEAVARLVAGHDAVINAAVDLTPPYDPFFVAAARALVEAGAGRLVVVGLASILENEDGELLMDTPGYPQEYRSFYLGHEAFMDVLRQAPAEVDWVVLSPSGDFDHTGASTGAYRLAPGRADSRVTYADFARAVLDEIDTPTHHRTHLGVEESLG